MIFCRIEKIFFINSLITKWNALQLRSDGYFEKDFFGRRMRSPRFEFWVLSFGFYVKGHLVKLEKAREQSRWDSYHFIRDAAMWGEGWNDVGSPRAVLRSCASLSSTPLSNCAWRHSQAMISFFLFFSFYTFFPPKPKDSHIEDLQNHRLTINSNPDGSKGNVEI